MSTKQYQNAQVIVNSCKNLERKSHRKEKGTARANIHLYQTLKISRIEMYITNKN